MSVHADRQAHPAHDWDEPRRLSRLQYVAAVAIETVLLVALILAILTGAAIVGAAFGWGMGPA